MAPRRTMAHMRWSDMDALGHVHNARYLEYFEAARASLVQELIRIDRPIGIGLVVGRHEVDYLVPLVYRPEPVAVDMWLERLGTSSFTLSATVGEPDGGVIYSRARTVVVAVDAQSGRPVPLPGPIRMALADLVVDTGDDGQRGDRPARADDSEPATGSEAEVLP